MAQPLHQLDNNGGMPIAQAKTTFMEPQSMAQPELTERGCAIFAGHLVSVSSPTADL